jgi:hypothetical protein
MKTLHRSLLLSIGALALAGTAFAQVPSTNDTSDGYDNTGMGTRALGGPTPVNLTGTYNTASGYAALQANTTGSYNTASGDGALYSNTTGNDNTASGYLALQANTTGSYNTASGSYALWENVLGNYNTAAGYNALYSNTTGNDNTAAGGGALFFNTTGADNTASGEDALYHNTTGNDNTAAGYLALFFNTTGADNTASGGGALWSNTTGNDNTASGFDALLNNTIGNNNTASGFEALYANTTGNYNSSSGANALYENRTGGANTASGFQALYHNTSGHYNIAEGYKAGFNLTTGSDNIDIGNEGAAADASLIRIGTQGTQTATYIAGIYNVALSGNTVVVTSTGQLGVAAVSSERFKTAIAPMGSATAKLAQLRPVSFKLKSDATATRQYGLIAEEVAKVYPELVIRNESGRIDGVRYDELAPMLLNEMQKKNVAQDAEIRDLKQQQLRMQQQMAELKTLNEETQGALQKLQAKEQLMAQR